MKSKTKPTLRARVEIAWTRLLLAILRVTTATLCLTAIPALADDRHHHHHQREHRDYILRRQEAYQVEGVPTDRLIIGRREIDIYSNGQMFEGDHMVGQKGDR